MFNCSERGFSLVVAFWISGLLTIHAHKLEASELIIFSATDLRAMTPVLESFKNTQPDIEIIYKEFDTVELFNVIENSLYSVAPDIVLSSAMDLQVKLVNDGFAQSFKDPVIAQLPPDSHWRSEVFGFTYEPLVFVYNKRAFEGRAIPRTRDELAAMLRSDEDFFTYRVSTYDIRRAGVGYLAATQDELRSSTTWRLNESFGRVRSEVTCCAREILESIGSGERIFGYNLLSSYAMEYAVEDPRVGIIFPEDYTLAISRLAFMHKKSRNPSVAASFMRYLLSLEGQQVIAENGGLFSIHPKAAGPFSISALLANGSINLHEIDPGPPLLVYQDQTKKTLFIRKWESALFFEGPVENSLNQQE